jgi:hypothetical protein
MALYHQTVRDVMRDFDLALFMRISYHSFGPYHGTKDLLWYTIYYVLLSLLRCSTMPPSITDIESSGVMWWVTLIWHYSCALHISFRLLRLIILRKLWSRPYWFPLTQTTLNFKIISGCRWTPFLDLCLT